ncbi:MAG: GNAT family N-acetyltransferase, partial [Desulfobacterales bacterium]|nr:GNAT family N-acetyltransferase [Desulfobacterales bacterium]
MNLYEYFLQTEHLAFRKWREDDLDLAVGLWGDLEVTKLFDSRGVLSKEQVRERLFQEIALEKKYKVQYWPIFLLENGHHIGACGLRPYDIKNNIFELGFHLRSAEWGKGYATEASYGIIRYAFEHLKVSKLFAGHNPQNTASRHVLAKLGFRYTHEEYYEPTGLMHPSYLLNP